METVRFALFFAGKITVVATVGAVLVAGVCPIIRDRVRQARRENERAAELS